MAKQTYRVSGGLPVAGHQPGEEFSHDFGDQTEVLLEGGQITKVNKKAAADAEPKTEKEG